MSNEPQLSTPALGAINYMLDHLRERVLANMALFPDGTLVTPSMVWPKMADAMESVLSDVRHAARQAAATEA